MSEIWRFESNHNLGTIQERNKINLPLPLANEAATKKNLRFFHISGELPLGLRVEGKFIIGVPLEVVRPTTSTFVIRAEEIDLENRRIALEDRTYSLTVEGFDPPEWRTPSGPLLIGEPQKLFVLDSTYVEYQLSAIDRDLSAGDELEFFIADGNGSLPLGLELYPNGIIKGIIDPILALDVSDQDVYFDDTQYDVQPFDFGESSNIGVDTFPYDTAPYAYNIRARTPRKLNRTHEFIVSVSDGEVVVDRKFRIFIVGDDFLRADNTIMRVGTGVFTADNTYFRGAVWLTPSNLGVRRASNYVTVFLDTFDANPTTGPLVYTLEKNNRDTTPSELPLGMFLDANNGELFGFVPYQPAVTREYRFTMTATKYDANAVTETEVALRVYENASIGQTFLKIYPLIAVDQALIEFDVIRIGNYSYKVQSYEDKDPITDIPYQGFAFLRLSRNLFLDVPSEFVLTKIYYVSAVANSTVAVSKEFFISIIGEVDSVITYVTTSKLEPLRSNFFSQLSVKANSSIPRAVVSYKIKSGTLPPGLALRASGEIVGKVLQFGNSEQLGLTLFDTKSTTFDESGTTLDRQYTVSILAEDQFKLSGITREFVIQIIDSDDILYSNLYARPYQRLDKKNIWENFISDVSIFNISKVYRPSDPSFGVQHDLKMLVYPGIETIAVSRLVEALAKNAKRKRFRLSDAKKAVAKRPGTNEIIYEVIYLEAIDSYETARGSIAGKIKLPNNISAPVVINQSRYDSADNTIDFTDNNPSAGVWGPGAIITYTVPPTAPNNIVYQCVNHSNMIGTISVINEAATLPGAGQTFVFQNPGFAYTITGFAGNNPAITVVRGRTYTFDFQAVTSGHPIALRLASGTLSAVLGTAKTGPPKSDDVLPRQRATIDAININSDTVNISGKDREFVYPTTIGNIRKNIKGINNGDFNIENEYLPLWMKTSQNSATAATGFIRAIPICYCNPGDADFVLSNIKNSKFKFSEIDYEIDRLIVDSTTGNSQEQFLKFSNQQYNI